MQLNIQRNSQQVTTTALIGGKVHEWPLKLDTG